MLCCTRESETCLWVRRLTARDVVGERKTQSIGTALRDALREQLLLALLGLLNLLFGQIAHPQVVVQLLQVLPADHVERVDDVAERLGHLAAKGIADHRVAEDLFEWHLASEGDAEEHHTGDPEKDNVPAGLEDAVGVKVLHVLGLPVSRAHAD